MMGQGQQPPKGPMAPAVDLDSLRNRGDQQLAFVSEQPAQFVNDVQPSVMADGTIVLEGRFVNPARMEASLPVRMAMPVGVFAALVGAAPSILEGATERASSVAERLGQNLAAGKAAAARASGQPGMEPR